MKLLLTMRETEAAVSMSASKIQRLVAEGRFPSPVRIDGNVRWKQKDLVQWADDLENGLIPPSKSRRGRPRLAVN